MSVLKDLRDAIDQDLVTCASRDGAVFADDTSLYTTAASAIHVIREHALSDGALHAGYDRVGWKGTEDDCPYLYEMQAFVRGVFDYMTKEGE